MDLLLKLSIANEILGEISIEEIDDYLLRLQAEPNSPLKDTSIKTL